MLFTILIVLGVLFLLALLFVPLYFFWVREKADDAERKDE